MKLSSFFSENCVNTKICLVKLLRAYQAMWDEICEVLHCIPYKESDDGSCRIGPCKTFSKCLYWQKAITLYFLNLPFLKMNFLFSDMFLWNIMGLYTLKKQDDKRRKLLCTGMDVWLWYILVLELATLWTLRYVVIKDFITWGCIHVVCVDLGGNCFPLKNPLSLELEVWYWSSNQHMRDTGYKFSGAFHLRKRTWP